MQVYTFIASQSFACGKCVSSSVFDSLVGAAPGSTALFEKLVTGGSMYPTKPTTKYLQSYLKAF